MKTLLILLSFIFILMGCAKKEPIYPRYSLTKINYVPDSLKKEYHEFIIKTISASHSHLNAGKYKNVSKIPYAIKDMADKIYQKDKIGLKKEINENYWDDIDLTLNEMNLIEIQIYKKLNGKTF